MAIFATYNSLGYTVFRQLPTGALQELHHGGNHPLESTTITSVPYRCSLRRIRSYAIRTARELALAFADRYLGVQRDDEPHQEAF